MKKAIFICCLLTVTKLFAADFQDSYATYHFKGEPEISDPPRCLTLGGVSAMIRARTKCYFIQVSPNAVCPDYVFGHSLQKRSIPLAVICAAAKRAAESPPGCQRKHCTPCTYD